MYRRPNAFMLLFHRIHGVMGLVLSLLLFIFREKSSIMRGELKWILALLQVYEKYVKFLFELTTGTGSM